MARVNLETGTNFPRNLPSRKGKRERIFSCFPRPHTRSLLRKLKNAQDFVYPVFCQPRTIIFYFQDIFLNFRVKNVNCLHRFHSTDWLSIKQINNFTITFTDNAGSLTKFPLQQIIYKLLWKQLLKNIKTGNSWSLVILTSSKTIILWPRSLSTRKPVKKITWLITTSTILLQIHQLWWKKTIDQLTTFKFACAQIYFTSIEIQIVKW